jgi:hypothetical protein
MVIEEHMMHSLRRNLLLILAAEARIAFRAIRRLN